MRKFSREAKLSQERNIPPQKSKLLLTVLIIFVIVAGGGAAFLYFTSDWNAPEQTKKLQNPVPPTEDAIDAGMMHYMDSCKSCHGENGDGKGERAEKLSIAPSDFTDAHAMSQATDGELFWKISHGHRPMPAFQSKLTDEERWQLVDYIRTFSQKTGAAPKQP
jgi:mono/diheme cytochrome c family protein